LLKYHDFASISSVFLIVCQSYNEIDEAKEIVN